MRLLSFASATGASFGVPVDGGVVDLGRRLGRRRSTLRDWLRSGASPRAVEEIDGIVARAGRDLALPEIRFLPTVPDAQKIVCIGVNYGGRGAEYADGAGAPAHPSVFMRTRESLVGHREAIIRPLESEQLDYEGEIALVIGREGRRIPAERAWEHIAGLTLMNEGSVRDWMRHSRFNVTQGKNFERSGSMGPWMVTADQLRGKSALRLTTRVNGEARQDDTTGNLLFSFERLVAYLSTFMRLQPGDVIATGTPTGAGVRLDPPRYLRPGDVVEVAVPEIGALVNAVEDERQAR